VPIARRHVLRFEVAPETFALFREASAHLRRNGDASFDDDAILLAMARAVLGGPTDEGRASYQVSLSVCSECSRAEQRANGALVVVGPEIVAMASCDAQHIGNVTAPANDNPTPADAAPDPATAPAPETETDADPSVAPSPTVAPHARHLDGNRHPAPVRAHRGTRVQRTQQTIPPALRRAILHRDHHRCCVPGCKNATFLDLHHIQPRSAGGSNDPANLVYMCGAHHRAVHRGQLIIERGPSGLRFLHADGRPYGEVGTSTQFDSHGKVASALRNLGFRDTEVRAVLADLRGDQSTERPHDDRAPRVMTTEQLLREALVRLGLGRNARR
jgi:5-methylcytosine-specific restriction endonuclease McrA